ncbi:MAG: RedB protein, partial [Deltaproteobacteria bacterium]|nr:RedB protein [Deltaproteobacteria bacterium]
AFDGAGKLAFSGGITASRGHLGENAGLAAVVQFVSSGKVPLERARVFGCSLFKATGMVATR